MKMCVTPYGCRELILMPLLAIAISVVAGVIVSHWSPWIPMAVFAVLVLPVLVFFRDPSRRIPDEPGVLLAPADGKVTDVAEVAENDFIGGAALRIGIFLSVLDVHINRAPCAGRVGYIKARPGKFFNALRVDSASRHNESNCVGLNCTDHPAGKVMVKQITGAIARRIVCDCRIDDELSAGQRFGMIKFGSRTELFAPLDARAEVLVSTGDTVRAGTTLMVRYGKMSGEDPDETQTS